MIFFIFILYTSYTLAKYYHIHSKLSSTGFLLNLYQLTYIIASNKNGSILIVYIFGFTAYHQLFNFFLISTHFNIKRLIGSNDLTYIATSM